MARRLPTVLQIQNLEDLCNRLNEDCNIDFRAEIDDSLTFGENKANLIANFPQFIWEDTGKAPPARFFEEEIIDQLRREAEPFNFDVIKRSRVESLQRDSRRAVRLGKKLETCEARPVRLPSRPGVCAVKSVSVKSYERCPPRTR